MTLFSAILLSAFVLPEGGARLGSVRGVVQDNAGLTLSSAEIVVEGLDRRTRSDAQGVYSIVALPAGTVRLTARRMGYEPQSRVVTLNDTAVVTIDWKLKPSAAQMAPVVIAARAEIYDSRLEGYRSRMEKKAGGHFITRERIDQSGNHNLLDAFRGIPGVRFRSDRGMGRMLSFRTNNCPPLVFIDGFPATAAAFDLETIDLKSVEGVEIYLSGTSVPAEFFGVRGGERCGVVAVWSRPAERSANVRAAPTKPRVDPLEMLAAATVYASEHVDEVAQPKVGALQVIYPEDLWRASTPGSVTAEFVVDTTGIIDWSTFSIISSTHPQFSAAVQQALLPLDWVSARLKGRRVRQLVHLPVHFERLQGSRQDPPREP